MQLKLAAKRVLDITVASFLLVLTMPVVLVAAFAIKIESSGPVIFRQTRIGKDKGGFKFYKLRSMYTGTDESAHREYIKKLMFSALPGNGGRKQVYKLVLDSRVTRVGRLLRKTSIDELPQLFNVLKGEMSMVGPRPAVPYELEYYTPDMFKRFSVKPGITGLWQTSGRYRMGYKEMVGKDIYYAEHWSLTGDLKILFKTIKAVLDLAHTF